MKILSNNMYLLLIDEEAEIKENTNTFKEGFNGDWFWCSKYNSIQRIGDITEFDFKIIAYYPLTKEAKELDLPLLPNPFDEVDIEKIALEWFVKANKQDIIFDLGWMKIFEAGYKAAFKQFSLEDMKKAIEFAYNAGRRLERKAVSLDFSFEIYREELIQSLSTQKLPKEFIPEYEVVYFHGNGYYNESELSIEEREKYNFMKENKLKTITNSEGKEELIGIYKY